jgi:hypothetical protein
LCHSNGEDLLHPEFKTRYRSLYLAACAHRYFGSWRRAVSAAGLDHEMMREGRVWTKARIQRTIEELARDGHPLGWSSVETRCPGIYRAARRRENFGSWHNALLAAGVVPPTRRRGSPTNALRNPALDGVVTFDASTALDSAMRAASHELDAPVAPPLPGGKEMALPTTVRQVARKS